MSVGLHRTAERGLVHWVVALGLLVIGCCWATVARAADVAGVVEQVSVDSYTDFLQNDLYAHDGEARQFGGQHDLAQQNIQERFESFGLSTRLDPFLYSGAQYYNVVGVLPGLIHPREIYLVGAHYDTVAGSPGACDNAAGVASVMEAARVLSQYLFEATIVFIAFDREEQGLIGSDAYAYRHAEDDIRAMIALDVVGYRPYTPDRPEYDQASLFYQSVRPEFADDLAEAMGSYAGLACGIARNPGALLSDYVPFDRMGLPAVVLTGYAGPTNYLIHSSLDSLDNPGYVDYEYGAQTTRGLVGYLATAAGLAPVRLRPDFNGDWKVDLEDLALLVEHWGQDDPAFDIAPPPRGDGIVDLQDLEGLMHYWGQELAEPGLAGHWKLDETEGATAADSAGVNHGTLAGNPLWQPGAGRVDGALLFDGLDDSVTVPCTLDPSSQPFSVFAWVRGGAPGQVILAQQGRAEWLMADASQGALLTELKNEGRAGRALCSPTPITDGDWHRVGLTWDGSHRILYVDDIEVAQDTQTGLPSFIGPLYLGAGGKRAAGSFWSGLIDDVKIYDRAVQP
jgi:hypothetical protein